MYRDNHGNASLAKLELNMTINGEDTLEMTYGTTIKIPMKKTQMGALPITRKTLEIRWTSTPDTALGQEISRSKLTTDTKASGLNRLKSLILLEETMRH
jgi:hypothetical protein